MLVSSGKPCASRKGYAPGNPRAGNAHSSGARPRAGNARSRTAAILMKMSPSRGEPKHGPCGGYPIKDGFLDLEASYFDCDRPDPALS